MSEDTTTEKRFPYLRDVIVAVVTGAFVLIGQMIMVGPQDKSASADVINAMNARISDLEASDATWREANQTLLAEVTSLRLENAALKVTLDTDLDFESLVCAILESQPGINWAKYARVIDDGSIEFRMLCLDGEYRARFELGPFEYVGQTDFEFWVDQPSTAQIFYANDLYVYNSRKPLVTRENWIEPNGEAASGQLTKFYFSFGVTEKLELIIGHLPRDVTVQD